MKIKIEDNKVCDIKADIKIVLVVNKDFNHKSVKDKKELEFLGFKGEEEECCLVGKTLYVGCNSLYREDVRLACGAAIKALKKTKAKSVKVGSYLKENLQAMAEAFVLASYSFNKYKSKKSESELKEIVISTEDYKGDKITPKNAKELIQKGEIIAKVTNFSKDLVNTPPYEMNSLELERVAKKIAKLEGVTCKVYGKEFLEKEGMGAFLAVNRASHIPPRLIHLVYKPKRAKKRYVFVGKGLTYDTGGLSLKPSDYMVSMKSDMSGASAVLGVLKGAAMLELPYEVHAIVGATENAIGPEAYKPDDVLTAKNGKTIEIKNTDAEGRLVLADCLCYACEQKPDVLVDMATLTGACVVALGEYTTGVMGHSSKLKHSLASSAKLSGELTGSLPFNRYLKKLLKSQVADLCNISSSRYGGAITAGLFLDNFVEDKYKDRWLHLDIAGPAYIEKDWGYNQCGASGAGVRMSLYWMMENLKEEA